MDEFCEDEELMSAAELDLAEEEGLAGGWALAAEERWRA